MSTLLMVAAPILIIWVIQRYLDFRRTARDVGNFPGPRMLFPPAAVVSRILPRIRGITAGWQRETVTGFKEFEEYGWEAFAHVGAWPRPRATIYLADPVAIKEVTTYRARFPKPVQLYDVLSFFGRNIVASEGEEWKKYRKIASPAFSERNNKLVWDEAVLVMQGLFDDLWKGRSEIAIENVAEITIPTALFVISSAGFGRRLSWSSDGGLPSGHRLTFKDAMQVVSEGVISKLVVPRWAMGLTPYFSKVRIAYDELHQYMEEMIRDRRNSETKEERYDLLSSLIDASGDGDPDSSLTDSQLLGNVFIFMLAGHETAAHTLSFCFALLALHPAEQERLYDEIQRISPDPSKPPTYNQMSLFVYALAVLYETLRLAPAVVSIPKESAEDTSLVVTSIAGEKQSIPLLKGTDIVIYTTGLHANPRYWPEPDAFKPERFLGDWPRDAFIPFSAGPRACIGRRFFETEGVAALVMLVSQYTIEIKEEPDFAKESFSARKERIMQSKPGLTTTPVRVPLVFKRRSGSTSQ
ncbi:614/534 cytochrome P450 [Auriscalpium vulgare]|uniref:614/534 cytochrome P450 n=1 Tax=Auriscalpium vulgare TaxID=40419 RepID=A0ACB8S8B5_9AGAM|nr:614/534 cytochrome P450 [Auriscalpium vulgare]